MDPVQGGGPWTLVHVLAMFCPHIKAISKSEPQKDVVTVHSYFVIHFISLLHLIRHKYINFLMNSFFELRKSCHQTL